MPFRSQKQRRWMHAEKPEMAARWEAETPDDAELPVYAPAKHPHTPRPAPPAHKRPRRHKPKLGY